ncbi:hypothetical protein HBI65_133820 [Parastagonospora nodorum]|nr:hypothetical protein HBI84_108320 [Parastagonospora nodorum]KAH6093815.1 hypothetical protein HBI65_133820 [Parastagonospora nodorum]
MMFSARQPGRQRLVYRSQLEESSATEADDESFARAETKADIVAYLSVASAWEIDIISYTWYPNLGDIGQGQTGGIQQSIANLQTSFAFKTFDRLSSELAFEEAISEIRVLGDPQIRGHPNIISLEGICWNILATGDVLPVLVFEKTNLGSLSSFMQRNNETSSIETRLRIAICIIRAISILYARDIFHGDIKPENILLFQANNKDITAKVTDFSFAVVQTDGSTFRPKPGTPRWRDPGWHYRSQWNINRAKGADMYSLGLLLLWLLAHDQRSALDYDIQVEGDQQPEKLFLLVPNRMESLGLPDLAKQLLTLLFKVCFDPDPSQRTLAPDDMQLLQIRRTNERGAQTADYQLLQTDHENQNSLGMLALSLERSCLQEDVISPAGAEARLRLPHQLGTSLSISKEPQLNLFDIATPLYSAHYRVRASVTEALCQRIRSADYPSTTDLANLFFCLQLGFGMEKPDAEKEKLMSHFDKNTAESTAVGLEEYKKTYRYRKYDDSAFRIALKLGHLDSLDLAQTYVSSTDAHRIEEECQLELAGVQRVLGPTHHIACTLMATLASLYYLRDKLSDAAHLQKSLLDIYHYKYGDESQHTHSAKINLAVTYSKDGHYDEAETLFTEVLAYRRRSLGEDHIDTLLVQSDLATMSLTRGKWTEAEILLSEVVQRSVVVLGAEHPHSIIMHSNFSSALQNNGKADEAKLQLEIALIASSKVHGESHVETLTCLSNLMSMYNDSKVVDKTTNQHLARTEAAALCAVRLYDQNHSLVLQFRSNIAQAYIDRSRYEEAAIILCDIIRRSRERIDANHIDTLTMEGTLFHVLYHQGKWEEATQLGLRTLANMDEQQNPNYPVVLGNLGAVYSKRKDFSKAIEFAFKAYSMQLLQCGPEHRLTVLALENLQRYQGAVARELADRHAG